MTRIALGAAIGIMAGIVLGAALGSHAQSEVSDETLSAANDAGVDAIDLQGALNTLTDAGIPTDARSYLISVGQLPAPMPPPAVVLGCGWPICGPLGQRIFCIEAIESHHGAAMYNPTPWHGEHAQGWLGFLPSTARRWGAVIGNRVSEWAAAAAMIRAGAGSQFAGIAWGRC